MTLAGLTSKFMMIDVYDSVHKNYQLVCMHVVISYRVFKILSS